MHLDFGFCCYTLDSVVEMFLANHTIWTERKYKQHHNSLTAL